MIRPSWRAIMAGSTARIARYVPFRLTSMTRVHTAGSCSARRPLASIPAAVTSTTTEPNSATARRAMASMSSPRVTSARSAAALAPAARASSATPWTSRSTSETSTRRAPSRANARAMARPMPRPPPVSATTLSRNLMGRLHEAAGDAAQAGERGADGFASLEAEHLGDRARQHDVAGAQAPPRPSERIGQPRERVQRAAHYLSRGVGRDHLAVVLEHHALLSEVEPDGDRHGLAQNSGLRVHAVGDDIRAPRLARDPEIDQLEGRHDLSDGGQRRGRRHSRSGKIRLHPKRRLHLDREADEAGERHGVAARERAGGEQEAEHRLGDAIAMLKGLAREADLPADHPLPASHECLLERALDLVGALEREIGVHLGERRRHLAGEPALDQSRDGIGDGDGHGRGTGSHGKTGRDWTRSTTAASTAAALPRITRS